MAVPTIFHEVTDSLHSNPSSESEMPFQHLFSDPATRINHRFQIYRSQENFAWNVGLVNFSHYWRQHIPRKLMYERTPPQWELQVKQANCLRRGKRPRSTRVCFNFASDWLREWRQFSRPITERSKAKTKQRLITFDTHLINLHFRLLITKYTLCNEIAMESEVCSTLSFL